jgi:hypothetical protein
MPVESIDPATGRPTTASGELARFGMESDGFVGVCEARVLLGAQALVRGEEARRQAAEELRPRTWWERVTPWRE